MMVASERFCPRLSRHVTDGALAKRCFSSVTQTVISPEPPAAEGEDVIPSAGLVALIASPVAVNFMKSRLVRSVDISSPKTKSRSEPESHVCQITPFVDN